MAYLIDRVADVLLLSCTRTNYDEASALKKDYKLTYYTPEYKTKDADILGSIPSNSSARGSA
jgi:hypothetical protein